MTPAGRFCLINSEIDPQILRKRLFNIFVPRESDKTTEIDVVLICSKAYSYLNAKIIAVGFLATKHKKIGRKHYHKAGASYCQILCTRDFSLGGNSLIH